MHRYISGLVFIIVLIGKLEAQSYSIKGSVNESDKSPAIGASVFLLQKSDSLLVKGNTTDKNGNFILDKINTGDYLLKITYLGATDYFKTLNIHDNIVLESITLKNVSKNLQEVKIETDAIIATQNGDTTSYNSKAFKTNKDATAEDLLNKMPGITNTDGKIQAQGEDVKQVFVDGKPFFGEDPNSVLKNLPAEIIEKVQVFDKKSDQSQFTGFDDGNTSKTINIVTKAQFRNGIFGKLYSGYGYQDKFKGGGSFNRFKNKQRFTVLILSNNVNEQNFNSEDLLGVMSSSGNSGGRRGGSSRGGSSSRSGQSGGSESFLVDTKNGLIITNAFGLNYSDAWGKKINVSGSYFYNQTDNNAKTNLLRQYVLGGSNGLNYDELNDAKTLNDNHRLNMKIEFKPDSQNTITLQPKLSMQVNNGKSQIEGENKRNLIISNTSNNYKSSLNGYNVSVPLLIKHAFAMKGRTISLDINPSYNQSAGGSRLTTFNNYYIDSVYTDTIDQKSVLQKTGFSTTSNFIVTEPLGQNSFISVNYIFTYNVAESEKNTYSRNKTDFIFSERDTALSSVFDNSYSAHAAGLNYRFSKEKVNFSFGVTGQQAQLEKHQSFPTSINGSKIFQSVLPNAQFQYKFSQKSNLRFNYRSNNTPPSIDQMQDVINNSNSLQLSTGNPDLKQNFQNNVSLRFTGVNPLKSTSVFVLVGANYTKDYIGNNTIIASRDTVVYNDVFLPRGSQISRPENLGNYYSLRFFFNYSFPIKKIKSNLNINAGCNYSNVPALINREINYSNTTAPSLGLVLSSNISEKIDFLISSNTAYYVGTNSLQNNLNTEYMNQTSRVKFNITPWKGLVISGEYTSQYYNGLTDDFNQFFSLLSGSIGYKFLKNRQADLRLFVYDILNQNTSIQRSITETYIEDARTNNLQRYAMLIFTYNFKKYFNNEAKKQDQ